MLYFIYRLHRMVSDERHLQRADVSSRAADRAADGAADGAADEAADRAAERAAERLE